MDGAATADRSQRALEVGVVLVLAPLIQLGLFLLSGVSFQTHAAFAFVTGIPALYFIGGLVWWLMRRRGSEPRDVGWETEGWLREAAVGAGSGVCVMVLVAVLGYALPSEVPRGPRPTWAALVYGFGLVTAFAPIEEFVWRGWAYTELVDVTGSRWLSVGVCSVAFGALHWWGGAPLVATTTVTGAAYAGVYLWRESLVATVTAHFVTDLPLFFFMLFQIQPPQ